MKNLVLIILMAFPFIANAQDYTIDGDNITVTKVVDNIEGSKDEIYARVKSYFTRSYGSANSVIQADDRESGLVIGKGIYPELAVFALGTWGIKAYHILRVDIKEGRARIICSASTMMLSSRMTLRDNPEYRIIDYAPFTNKRVSGGDKGVQKKAFTNLVSAMHKSVNSLEEAIKSGGVLESEKGDW